MQSPSFQKLQEMQEKPHKRLFVWFQACGLKVKQGFQSCKVCFVGLYAFKVDAFL